LFPLNKGNGHVNVQELKYQHEGKVYVLTFEMTDSE